MVTSNEKGILKKYAFCSFADLHACEADNADLSVKVIVGCASLRPSLGLELDTAPKYCVRPCDQTTCQTRQRPDVHAKALLAMI